MGELTAQAGTSNCKTWYENEFQVSYETWPQTRSFSYQVLQSSFLKSSEIPLSGQLSHEWTWQFGQRMGAPLPATWQHRGAAGCMFHHSVGVTRVFYGPRFALCRA